MFITVKNRKCLVLVMGLMLLAGMVETARASCDVEEVCKLVEMEKMKIRKDEQSLDTKKDEQSSDTKKDEQSSDTKKDMQLFATAMDKISQECGYKMDAYENECKLEKVIGHCWNENEAELENCKR